MTEQQLDCALDLMRRLPPQQCEKNLADLIDLIPHKCEELLTSVDQPLKIAKDKTTGKEYLLCDYNRDGDSYRSPWTNTYEPPLSDGAMPSEELRKIELSANAAFEAYKDMYYEGGVSSVYFWDLDCGFAGVVLIKKAGDGSKMIKGCWDAIHVVEVQMEQDHPVTDSSSHVVNIGKMIEEKENKIRSELNEIYFGKTKQIVAELRSLDNAADKSRRQEFMGELSRAVKQHKEHTPQQGNKE